MKAVSDPDQSQESTVCYFRIRFNIIFISTPVSLIPMKLVLDRNMFHGVVENSSVRENQLIIRYTLLSIVKLSTFTFHMY
jgi:hypothetical protein